MLRSTSVYLDLLRLAAAMLVFLGHATMPFLAGDRFSALTPYMGDAVMLFFVLSGFVIGHATQARPGDARGYAVARLARIYSVALPALALTLVLDSIGGAIRPEYYAAYAGTTLPNPVLHHLLPVFFLNHLWYFDFAMGTAGAYWSLCYEFWYYVAFGGIMFLRGWRRFAFLALLGLLVGPKIAVYFSVWLVGLAAHALCQRQVLGQAAGLALCLGGLLLTLLAATAGVPGEAAALRWFAPVLGDSNITHHLGLALAFAAHLVGFNAIAGRLTAGFAAIERPVRWLAGATFTIYLFHLPVIVFLAAVLPLQPGSGLAALVLLGGGMAILLGIAEVTERRKRPWQALFAALLTRPEPSARRALSP